MHDKPPFEAFFVVEVDIEHDRDSAMFSSIRGPFATRDEAEREKGNMEEAWENALEEWEDGNPYDFKGWDIVKKNISDYYLSRLERQDEESYQILREASNAVGASLLAEEGIGPLAGDDRD